MSKPHMPALTRTFAGLPRCGTHRHSLLTGEGACPQCHREESAARERTAEEEREHRRIQALHRVSTGRRRMTYSEAQRIAAGGL